MHPVGDAKTLGAVGRLVVSVRAPLPATTALHSDVGFHAIVIAPAPRTLPTPLHWATLGFAGAVEGWVHECLRVRLGHGTRPSPTASVCVGRGDTAVASVSESMPVTVGGGRLGRNGGDLQLLPLGAIVP